MPNTPIAQRALGWVRRFAPRQLIAAGILVALVIGGSIALVSWASTPTYTVLFSGLTGADAGAITAKLDADGVKYKLESGGSTIMVPQDAVDTTRIAMATANLPANSIVGYELLDKQSITTDSFTQQVNYARAKEGELAKTIGHIDGVTRAEVQLVMPQERLFTEQETPARASVMLTTNRIVSDSNVAAITHLVASSVPNLDPSNVTIVDKNGRLLSDTSAAGTGTGDQRKAQAAYEATLEEQATSMLARVVGEGKAVVRVNATMDFTQRTRATEVYDPKRSAAKETSTSKESYQTTTQTPAGTLTSNPAQPNPNPTTTTQQQYSKSADAQALNNTKTITQEVEAPGAVKRLTVSVLMDSKTSGGLQNQQVQSLVSNALGVDTQRGDSVVVDTAAFDTSADAAAQAADKKAEAAAAAAAKNKLYVMGGAGALILIALIGLLIMALKSRKTKVSEDEIAAARGAVASASDVTPDITPTMPTARMPLTVNDRENEAAAVLASVDARPEDAARALRGLMAEDSVRGGQQ